MAKPRAPTYAEKVHANEREMIETLLGGTCVDRDGAREGVYGGVVATRLSIVDATRVRKELLVTPAAAVQIGAARRPAYERGSREGFVAIVVGRDPRVALESNLGNATGAAVRDARTLGAAAAEGAAARADAVLAAQAAAGR